MSHPPDLPLGRELTSLTPPCTGMLDWNLQYLPPLPRTFDLDFYPLNLVFFSPYLSIFVPGRSRLIFASLLNTTDVRTSRCKLWRWIVFTLVPTSCRVRLTCPWAVTCKPSSVLHWHVRLKCSISPSASSYLGLGFLPFKLGFFSYLSIFVPGRSRLIFASLFNTTDVRICTSVSFTVDWGMYTLLLIYVRSAQYIVSYFSAQALGL